MKCDNKNNNETPGALLRFKALFFDWLFICVYLLLLFIITIAFYFLVLNGILEFTNYQSQIIG